MTDGLNTTVTIIRTPRTGLWPPVWQAFSPAPLASQRPYSARADGEPCAIQAMKRLGTRQREKLRVMSYPLYFQVVPDRVTDSLVRIGLMTATSETGGFVQITPMGLRVIADEWDAGRVAFLPPSPPE